MNTVIELGDWYIGKYLKGIEIEIELEDHGDTPTNGHIIAKYTIRVVDMLNYELINKSYAEHLTIKETKECDKYIDQTYENQYFEDAIVEKMREEDDDEYQFAWFI